MTMKYFSIEELCRSEAARRLGIVNRANEEVEANLRRLVREVLDPLREAWGGPVTVNSGFRCTQLNQAVGGVPHSAHRFGLAADITVGSRVSNRRLLEIAARLCLPYDQLIFEHGGEWLHVSVAAEGRAPRRQLLMTKGKGCVSYR